MPVFSATWKHPKGFGKQNVAKCWENIYDYSEHSHRDPVANVVIYSSVAFFFGFVALGPGFV